MGAYVRCGERKNYQLHVCLILKAYQGSSNLLKNVEPLLSTKKEVAKNFKAKRNLEQRNKEIICRRGKETLEMNFYCTAELMIKAAAPAYMAILHWKKRI